MSAKQKTLFRLLVFVISFATVIYFQRTSGRLELFWMLMGLIGILWSLYDYNRSYR